ncbi:Hypothetical predicted protein [Paramuricea clavata]|uniref:Uncharacterized protein n=1 Tax=Paramuricea clavata TaxID=317549 RepID=A0A7D9JNQ8_PARCT|nr:Hypothetical predicted protein [Paramuricea clavata]
MLTNAATWPPPKNEIKSINSGKVYLHVTTIDRWGNVDQASQVKRVPGMVNALGRGFYTYPQSAIIPDRLSVLIQWAHIDAEDEEEMRSELKKVRIVAVYPNRDVPVWIPQGTLTLPPGSNLDKLLTNLSNDRKLNFLAISLPGNSQETVWLKTKVEQGIVHYPMEDSLPMDFLVIDSVRGMTDAEIKKYILDVWGNSKNKKTV